MKASEIPFPEEITHLSQVLALLDDAVQEAEAKVNHHDQDYKDSKRYIAEYQSEIDPQEIFQSELLLKDVERSGMIAVKARDRLRKLLDAPYFSRIDFVMDGDVESETYYIGRFTFSQGYQIQIYDWRAPIADMFYDYELGRAGYDAPMGRIEGTLTRKRQFKIKAGVMEFVLESSMNIRDEVLQRELSSTADDKMKTIIATLQKEQNVIIRDEKAETMIIQGVAGSGKTSIALHRIAYLLYRFKDTLSAKNIVILSPNKVFGDYISNVLPELGEEPIYEISFADIAAIQLDKVIGFEPDHDPLASNDPDWAQRTRYKSTLDFIIALDDYLADCNEQIFEPADYTYDSFTIPALWIKKRYQAYLKYPVKRRLTEMTKDILDKLKTDNIREEELPGARTIHKSLVAMLKIKNTLALYKGFWKQIGKPEYFVMPHKKMLEWADVYPFLYLHAFYAGFMENQRIDHIVIDEMQDYSLIQYEVINLLFRCKKTILGDFGQAVNPNNQNSLEWMRDIYPDAKILEMNKSYRSSFEIINFAKRIFQDSKLEAVERHGEEVELIGCVDEQAELSIIKARIARFLESGNTTLGIITKTNGEAKAWNQILSKEYTTYLITPESDHFTSGIIVTSVQMSKGLEFDEVILPSANQATYYKEYERSLLYIACTRAMHRLTITYTGKITDLIAP